MATTGTTSTSYNLTPFGTVKQEVTKPTGSTKSGSESDSALETLGNNFDQFLTMLTTQMKNQDPLNPMDSNQMTSQLVQFSQVEQSIGTNKRLDKLLGLQETYTTAGNLFYLNRVVEYEGQDFVYQEGMTGIELGYELAENAKSVRVDILDSQNRIVSSTVGETSTGTKHRFAWDFKDDQGNTVPPGTYHINVAPVAKETGKTIKATTYTAGVVTAVDNSDPAGQKLKVNGTAIALDKVTAIR